MPAGLQFMDGHELRGNRGARLGSFANDSILKDGEKILQFGEANGFNHVTDGEGVKLVALNMEATGAVAEENILTPALISDGAFDVDAFARRAVSTILGNIVEREDGFVEGIGQLRFFDNEIRRIRNKQDDSNKMPELAVVGGGGGATDANGVADEVLEVGARRDGQIHMQAETARGKRDVEQIRVHIHRPQDAGDLNSLTIFDASHQLLDWDGFGHGQWRGANFSPARLGDDGSERAGMTQPGDFHKVAGLPVGGCQDYQRRHRRWNLA